MTQTELDSLVAQIGEEILARMVGQPEPSPQKGRGAEPARPGMPGVCSALRPNVRPEHEGNHRRRRRSRLRLRAPDENRPHHRFAHRSHHSETRGYTRRRRQGLPRSPPVFLRQRLREPVLGAPGQRRIGRLSRQSVHRRRLPAGATSTEAKVAETAAAVRAGAQEIDMVINVGALRSGDHEAVKVDIQQVVKVAHAARAIVKVILETALLDDNQKAVACTLCKLAGADFVKTSTGFSTAGATAHDIALMRSVVGPDMGVKASGGIRTLSDLKTMTAAGATRIGASASVKIVEATAA